MPKSVTSMPCPVEGCHGITVVKASSLSKDKLYRYRRRRCKLCGARQSTAERYIGPVSTK